MKIRGNTVGIPNPQPNFDQTNPLMADYIRGDYVGVGGTQPTRSPLLWVNGDAQVPDAGDFIPSGGSIGGASVELDTTLTQSGKAADAKAVGDALAAVEKPSAEQIAAAVEKYLEENPVEGGGSGEPGADGFSPVANVTQTAGGAVITITDKSGTTTATIVNGKDGKDGVDGSNGNDGVSATHSWSGTTLTITSASGTSSANLKGEKGDTGADGKDGGNGKDGVSVTHSWNGTTLTITSASGTSSANLKGDKGDKGDTGSQGIQGEKGDKGDTGAAGATGRRGTGLLPVTTAPSSYTTAVNGLTPAYRIALSTVKTQASTDAVYAGDTVRYSYYHYPVIYVDNSYVYCGTRVNIRGATGAAGTDGKDYSFDPTVYRLPVLYLTGDTAGMTKETEVTLSYQCNDKNGTAKTGSCTMKWQGSSSLAWDKKNYTIKFDNAFEAVDGWGSQKKYCLKANWIDHSHSRNVVSAKLWGLIRKNRSNLNSKLKALPNAGAIDGFPIIIMLNDEFHGLYSFNIPKDAWMFGMGSGTKEAIVGADNQADDTAFKAETLLDADGWELEYNSSSFSADAVKTSLNNLIKACIDSWGGDLDTTVAQYLDWESAIDYYIFATVIQGGDMITKNTMLATFDGVKWYFSAYDMDTTYGLEFDGSKLNRSVTTSHTTFETIADAHRVFELIKRFKTNELKARYNALRADALSESRICSYFENYAWDISSPLLVEEVKKWPSVRGSAVNGIDQICRWVRQRLEVTDKWIEALPAQETPVEPEKPVEIKNWARYGEDTAAGSIYNSVGYKDNARLSSSGGVSGSAQNGSVVTGFIPFKNTDIIRMKGAEFVGATTNYGGHFYFNLYDSNKGFIANGGLSSEVLIGGTFSTQVSVTYDETTGVTTIQILNPTGNTGDFRIAAQKASYFRINAYGKGADLIVTVNQEIT